MKNRIKFIGIAVAALLLTGCAAGRPEQNRDAGAQTSQTTQAGQAAQTEKETQTEKVAQTEKETQTEKAAQTEKETQKAQESGTKASSQEISEEEAAKIALDKVPGASEKDLRLKKDYEDGRVVYEGSIVYKEQEYEFEIDANNGTILEWDQESIYD